MTERVIIVGSGPAGWAAAIYAARATLSPLVFEGAITQENQDMGTLPLGQLNLTTEVENYPGFPAGNVVPYLESALPAKRRADDARSLGHGVSGPELMELMRQQANNFGTRIVTDDVVDVDCSKRPFVVKTLEGETHQAQSIIIATGARANYLGLPSEDRFKNRGVSACAVCDGALPRFRDKPLVVVGGGDQRDGRGDLPHEVRLEGLPRPSPRLVPRQQDHGRTRPGESEDRREVELGRRRSARRRRARASRA